MPKDVSIYEEQMQVYFPIDDAALAGNYDSNIKQSAYNLNIIYMNYIYSINTACIDYKRNSIFINIYLLKKYIKEKFNMNLVM